MWTGPVEKIQGCRQFGETVTRSNHPITTEAHRVIEALNLSPGQLAGVANCSKTAAQHWRKGTAVPDQDRRIALEKRWPELHRGTWTMLPQCATGNLSNNPATQGETKPRDDSGSPEEFIDARTSAKQHLADVQRMIREAKKSDRLGDILKLTELERKAILGIARFSGELTPIDENELTDTRRWKEVREVVTTAVAPYPDAAKALNEALEGIGA